MDIAVRIILCSAFAVISGAAGVRWAEALKRERKIDLSFPKRSAAAVSIVMMVPGAALGAFSRGLIEAAFGIFLLFISSAVAVLDWFCRIIPNQAVLALLAGKVLLLFFGILGIGGTDMPGPVSSLSGLALGLLLFSFPAVFGRSVGAGDIKLAAAAGFFLGVQGAAAAVVVMGMLIIAFMFIQSKYSFAAFLKTQIPMGPFIAIGMLVSYISSVSLLSAAGQ